MLEQEVKLTVIQADTLETILSSEIICSCSTSEVSAPVRFFAKYYDTEKRAFQNKKSSLRVRLEGDRFLAALKLKGEIKNGLSAREEYECNIDGWIDCIDHLPEGDLKDKCLKITNQNAGLHEIVCVDMQRRIVNLEFKDTGIEMVADKGKISANNSCMNLYELELELKKGELGSLVEMGKKIKENFDLEYSQKTKYEIGLGLYD